MEIKVIRNSAEFRALGAEWNQLLQSSASDCVFLTHEWLFSWWKHMGGRRTLHIVTLRDQGALIGVLPLAERRPQYRRMMPRALEFLGSGVIGSDYLDAIITRGREREAAAAFAERLRDCRTMLQFSQLRGGANAAALLAEELGKGGWAADEAKINICPYIDLRGLTWETYLASLGPNVRKNVKRRISGLQNRFDFHMHSPQTPGDAEAALEIVMDLHHKRWIGRESEAFQSESVIAFHREFVRLAAARGWLRVFVIYLDGAPASALYGLRYGSVFYFYQSGFDPAFSSYSAGLATMGLAIKSALDEGALEYDLLHGDEEYKFHWAREVRNLVRLEVHPPEALSRICRRAAAWNRSARQMARRVLLTRHHVEILR